MTRRPTPIARRAALAATALAGAAALAAAGFYAGRHSAATAPMPGPSDAKSAAESAKKAPAAAASPAERKVLYWHDPMVPDQRFDKPGKSPFMDMQLVPVYADDAAPDTAHDTPHGDAADAAGSASEPGGVRIGAALQQNLGLRTARVRRTDAAATLDAVGTVQFDERLGVAVQSRVAGFVEHLAVRAPMERVRQGQALATVFAPDWLGPQNEWLALKRATVAPDVLAAARQRLRAMSIPDELVRRSEEAGSAQARFTLTAPVAGVVAELGVREGAAVTPGMTLFRIAGLDRVWAVADVPESQALQLSPGQKVQAFAQADPAQTFEGRLAEILPQVSAGTRTLQARFEVDNRRGRLVPGLLLRLQIATPGASRLVVPAEAVIRTGTRAVVLVRTPGGAFESRDVGLGAEGRSNGNGIEEIEITRGLREGEEVVASGQFLIDSEARLRSVVGDSVAAPVAVSKDGASGAAR